MEVKLKTGRKISLKSDLTLDERDQLLDQVKYEWGDNGKMKGISMMNSTMTKFIRTCVVGDTSDKELLKWSIDERTEVFLKIQEWLSLGEGKASK